jgi:hypothetical protein
MQERIVVCGKESDARRVVEDAIRLAGAAAEGWWVLNSIEIRESKGNTDLDLLIGIPNVGLLIVEVKGWTAFEVTQNGEWFYSGRAGQRISATQGPYKQAHREEYLLLDFLSTLRSRGKLTTGPLPKIGSQVLFGNLDSDASGILEIHRIDTLFRDTFCPGTPMTEGFAHDLLNRLRNALLDRAKPDREMLNSKQRLQEVRDLLNPLCSVRGLGSFLDHAQVRLDELAETGLGERAAGYDGTRLYVEGAAGTGKTCFALKLAIDRSRQSGRQGLYVCFSTRLAEEVRTTPWVASENIAVCTPEELLSMLGRENELDKLRALEANASAAAQRTAELLGTSIPDILPRAYLDSDAFSNCLLECLIEASPNFCAVVIDEAQDLPDLFISSLEACVASDDLFAVFADPRQTTRRERSGLPWQKPAFTVHSDQQTLLRNYRNGDRIIDHVEHEFRIGYHRPPFGAAPAEVTVDFYQSASELTYLAKRTVSSLRDVGLDPTVLVAGVNQTTREMLEDLDIQVADVDEYKGLERKSIVLVLGPDLNPLDPNREDLYVGLTRATVNLNLLCTNR